MELREALLTNEAKTILRSRYLRKNDRGELIETPEEMFERVARSVAEAGRRYGKNEEEIEERFNKFYNMMADLEFLPNSPTLMNTGTANPQAAACFVLPVGDSMRDIFQAVKDAALVHQSGGGTGFDFSALRPEGDLVRSTGGVASGPISFMKVFNAATDTIKQGGKRRGANMGVLRVDHPDIEKFISCKDTEGELSNFNISVALTDKFMKAVVEGEQFELISPRDKRVVKTLDAKELFDKITEHAWKNGEPGIIFIDEINRHNPNPDLGDIQATNPCGEQPLLPREACNLGSINLAKMVKNGVLDVEKLKETVFAAVDFLDSVIDTSVYPLEEIEEMVKKTRKIGLGVMGFADMLALLGIPYDSDDAVAKAEEISYRISAHAEDASLELGRQRGTCPAYYDKEGEYIRNSTLTTIAPTGTISMIANCSSGCEPLFGVVYRKVGVLDGKTDLWQVNEVFKSCLEKEGLFSEEILKEISDNGGRLTPALKEKFDGLFNTALEIPWQRHIQMQAAFQKYVDNAVSKTINMPNNATVEDVKNAYMLAWEMGCKGLTVYRTGSRAQEVISMDKKETSPISSKKANIKSRPDMLKGQTRKIKTPSGVLWCTMNFFNGLPFEAFVQIGKGGSDLAAITEAISRLISLSLRAGVDSREVIKQLEGIGGNGHVGFGASKVTSVPDGIAKVMKEMLADGEEVLVDDNSEQEADKPSPKVDICPECGFTAMVNEGGCEHCLECGYSRC